MYSWKQISNGATHSLLLRSDGVLFTWGDNSYGQLTGAGGRSSPVQITATSWSSVYAGWGASFGIDTSNKLWAWGYNTYGQLGLNDITNRASPVQVGNSSWVFVNASNLSNTVGVGAITSDGKLYVWGGNTTTATYNLGTGDSLSRSSPTQIATGLSFSMVSMGYSHGMAITNTGSLYGWGSSNSGQIAYGYNSWTIVSIGYAGSTSLGIRNDGTLFAWGPDNSYGQYGNNTTVVAGGTSSPIQIGTSSWTSVTSGNYVSFAIKPDGTLWAWGYNGQGQLGDGTTVNKSSPVQIGIGNSWVKVFNGGSFGVGVASTSAAIDYLGRLYTWGYNMSGTLMGDSLTPTARSSPVQVQVGSSWTTVAIGIDIAFAIRSDGLMFGWGLNNGGRLGDGTTVNKVSSVQVGTGYSWISVSVPGGTPNAYSTSTSAIRTDGTLWAWGTNSGGELGQGDIIARSSPVQVLSGRSFDAHVQGPYAIWAKEKDVYNLWACGFNDGLNSMLGDGTVIYRSSPVQLATAGTRPTKLLLAKTGNLDSVGYLTDNGIVYAWGNITNFGGNTSGISSPVQVGNINYNTRFISPTLLNSSSWISVAAGTSHTLAIKSDNTLWAWGSGFNTPNSPYGVLGVQTGVAKYFPTTSNTYIINTLGQLFATGDNTYGQLGNSNTTAANLSTVFVTSNTEWKVNTYTKVVGNRYSLMGLKTDGSIWAWGLNQYGQAGTKSNVGNGYSIPTLVTGLSFRDIQNTQYDTTNNSYASYGIRNDGTLWAWGGNGLGLLLDGTTNITSSRSSPVQVGSSTDWDSFTDGNLGSSVLAKKTNGSLYGWGDNTYGQLGMSNPVTSWVQLSVNSGSAYALRNDGRVYVWGSNNRGQLGQNDTINRSSPVLLDTKSYIFIASANTFSAAETAFFIRNDNTLWAVGNNASGRLGDGTTIYRSSPVQVAGSWLSVAAADYWTSAIASDYTLYTWGSYSNYNLGLSNTLVTNSVAFSNGVLVKFDRSSPVQISTSSFTQVSIGSTSGFAVTIDGKLFGWGDNSTTSNTPLGPVSESPGVSWISSVVGDSHVVTLRSDGKVFTWGSNTYGQYGTNNTTSQTSPVNVISGSYRFVTAGRGLSTVTTDNIYANTTFLIDTQYRLFGQGINTYGTLGVGNIVSRSSPTQIGAGSSWTYVSASGHVLAIKSDSTLWSWGYNYYGALGQGDTIHRSNPIQIPGSWSQVQAGGYGGSFGIKTDGSLWAWGMNGQGQLGLGDIVSRSSPVQVGTSSWTQISYYQYSTYGIQLDGSLYTWGYNGYYQLGNGSTSAPTTPTKVGTSSWSQVAAGLQCFIGVTVSGIAHGAGSNSFYQLGLSTLPPTYYSNLTAIPSVSGTFSVGASQTAIVYGSGKYISMMGNTLPNSVTNTAFGPSMLHNYSFAAAVETPRQIIPGSWSSVTAGAYHGVMGIKTDGTAYFWGGLGSSDVGYAAYNAAYIGVAGTAQNTNIIGADGMMYGIGFNSGGQLGNGSTTAAGSLTIASPTQVKGASWLQISTGGAASIGLRTDGTIYSWGTNTYGYAGWNSTVTRNDPALASVLNDWTSVSAGDQWVLGIRAGRMYAWGLNTNGTLGDNTTINKSSPVQIGTDTDWMTVFGGTTANGAIKTNYTLWMWGYNLTNQVGDGGTAASRSNPYQIAGSWTKVTSSANSSASVLGHTIGLQTDGTIWGWGDNRSYQLGLGDTTTRTSPVQILAGSFTNIATGGGFTLAQKSDGTLWGWGNNTYAQLLTPSANIMSVAGYNGNLIYYLKNYKLFVAGYNTGTGAGSFGQDLVYRSSPVQVNATGTFTGSWSMIAGQNGFYSGIKTDGTLWAWGNNNYGQTANNSTITRSSPVQVGVDADWATVICGSYHVLALKNNKTLYAWGLNTSGQLGINIVDSGRSSPVQVPGSWSTASAGAAHTLAINMTGTLYGWGINSSNELGRSTSDSQFSNLVIARGANQSPVYFLRGTSGKLYGWGWNNYGQLGQNDTTHRSSPVQLGTSSWTMVDTAYQFTAAIDSNKRLFVWGENTAGQLGLNDLNIHRSSPVQVGTSSWAMVSVSNSTTSAIDINGRLFNWGYNYYGNLADNTITNKSSPVQVAGSWTFVDAKTDTTFAIKADGTLWNWGLFSYDSTYTTNYGRSNPYQVGTENSWIFATSGNGGKYGIKQDYTLWQFIDSSSPVQIGIGGSWLTVSSNYASLALRSDYTVWGWGTPSSTGTRMLQTGDTRVVYFSNPVQIKSDKFTSFTSISAGPNTAVVLDASQKPWAFGSDFYSFWGMTYNDNSTLSSTTATGTVAMLKYFPSFGSNTTNTSSPVVINSTFSWTQVAAGQILSIALDNLGMVWTWGSSSNNGVGPWPTGNKPVPSPMDDNLYTKILANPLNTEGHAIGKNKKVYSWGLGNSYNFGNGSSVNTPYRVTPITTKSFDDIWTAGPNLFMKASDGSLWAVGADGTGSFGLNQTSTLTSPVMIANYWPSLITEPMLLTTKSFTNIAAGLSHAVGVGLDSVLYGWGGSGTYDLGLTSTARSSPVQISALNWIPSTTNPGRLYFEGASSVTKIGLGFGNSFVTTNQKKTYFSGNNNYGQAGFGNTTNTNSYVQVGAVPADSLAWCYTGNSASKFSTNTPWAEAAYINADFTLEAWIYPESNPASTPTTIFDDYPYGINAFKVTHETSQQFLFRTGYNTSGATWTSNQYYDIPRLDAWYHIAVVKKAFVYNFYVNGVQYGQSIMATDSGNSTTFILFGDSVNTGTYYQGRISNLRLVLGTAVYTSNFTPSTSPLTAITNTAWLLFQGSDPYANNNNLTTSYTNTNNFTKTGTFVGRVTPNPFDSTTYQTGFDLTSITYYTALLLNNQSKQLYVSGGDTGSYGILGINSTVARSNPTQIGYAFDYLYTSPTLVTTTSFAKVTSGWTHAAAITSTGALYTWGANSKGQLGIGDTFNRSSPVQVGTSSYSLVATGGSTTMAITSDNKIFAWGLGGKLVPMEATVAIGGFGAARSSPFQLGSLGTGSYLSVVMVQGTATNSIGTGAIIDSANNLFVWGDGTGLGLAAGTSYPTQVMSGVLVVPNISSPVQVGTGSWKAVSTSGTSSNAIDMNNTLWTWGLYGPAGVASLDSNMLWGLPSWPNLIPKQAPLSNVSQISVGGGFAGAITNGNNPKFAYLWGNNGTYQLGTSNTISRFNPMPILDYELLSSSSSPVQITTYDYTVLTRSSPVQVGTSSWTVVEAGDAHSFAINTSSVLFGWGKNNYGQLGLSDTINKSSPVQIATNVVDVTTGLNHSTIENINGTVYTFGNNSDGQLGDNT